MADVKVKVDADLCSGCGVCEGTAPEVFKINDENQAEVQPDGLAKADQATVVDAAESCPSEAIEVIDAAGKKIVPA